MTGGLPYHGGPGSNYMTHSLAAMTERLRADPGAHGVVSGVGMHMQKHAYGVWSTDPGTGVVADPAPYAAVETPVGIVGSPSGPATVATYSVLHGRDGGPERALLICDVAGRRPLLRLLGRRPGGAGGGRGGRADRPAGDADAEGPGELGGAGLSRRAARRDTGRVVGGLDGCRGGWVLATLPARGDVTQPGDVVAVTVVSFGRGRRAGARRRRSGCGRRRHPHRPGRPRSPLLRPRGAPSARAPPQLGLSRAGPRRCSGPAPTRRRAPCPGRSCGKASVEAALQHRGEDRERSTPCSRPGSSSRSSRPAPN